MPTKVRSLGAKNPLEGITLPLPGGLGGFNVGNVQSSPPIQSSVATPNPASAGVSGQPVGGMRVGLPDDGAGGSTGGVADASTGFSPSVTGFDSSLAGQGLSFATSLAGLPGLGTVGGQLGGMAAGPIGSVVGGVLGGHAQSAAIGKGLGAIPGGLTSTDPHAPGPVAFTGVPGKTMDAVVANILAGFGLGNDAPAFVGTASVAPGVNANLGTEYSGLAPTSMPVGVSGLNGPTGQSSPNMGFGIGVPGSTSLGPAGIGPNGNVEGHIAGVPMSMVPSFPDFNCFTADTPVLLADGQMVPIEKIRLGDRVRCYDWHAIRPADQSVTSISRHEPAGEMVYTINGINVTGRHRFATGYYAWTHADEIQLGQLLLGPSGELVIVRTVETSLLTEPVYNLCVGTLERTANFYVGDPFGSTYLVHNGSGGDGGGGAGGGAGGSTGGDAAATAAATASADSDAAASSDSAAAAAATAAADAEASDSGIGPGTGTGPTGDPGINGDPGDPATSDNAIGPPADDPTTNPAIGPPADDPTTNPNPSNQGFFSSMFNARSQATRKA